MIDSRIDWALYPRLASTFQRRPDENIYCVELRALLDATGKVATASMLAHLEKTAVRGD